MIDPSRHSKKIVATVSGKLPPAVETWHAAVRAHYNGDAERAQELLDAVIDEDVVFEPPTYYKQRRGKAFTTMALAGILQLFEEFEYEREFIGERDVVLEFRTKLGGTNGVVLHGADLFRLSQDGTKIVHFTVLARSIKALNVVLDHQTAAMKAMGAKL